MTERNREAWLDFALKILVAEGPEAIKVDPLCRKRGVTKGSFYHHFKNRQVFIEALLEHWYALMTVGFIEQADDQTDPLARLKKLDELVEKNDIEAETHIRAWALREPVITPHLEKIDQQRQAYLAQCYRDMGIADAEAKDLATIVYAQLLGMQQIQPRIKKAAVTRLSVMAGERLLGVS